VLLTMNGGIIEPRRDGRRCWRPTLLIAAWFLDEPLKRVGRIGEELHLHEVRS